MFSKLYLWLNSGIINKVNKYKFNDKQIDFLSRTCEKILFLLLAQFCAGLLFNKTIYYFWILSIPILFICMFSFLISLILKGDQNVIR